MRSEMQIGIASTSKLSVCLPLPPPPNHLGGCMTANTLNNPMQFPQLTMAERLKFSECPVQLRGGEKKVRSISFGFVLKLALWI